MSEANPDAVLFKPTVCLDFDGVIHSYEHGWYNGKIYGTPTAGFFDWAERALPHFALVIHSTRAQSYDQVVEMHTWLRLHLAKWRESHPESPLRVSCFTITKHKPPALVYIDDRAVQFRGDWTSPDLSPDGLLAFAPWNLPGTSPRQ